MYVIYVFSFHQLRMIFEELSSFEIQICTYVIHSFDVRPLLALAFYYLKVINGLFLSSQTHRIKFPF